MVSWGDVEFLINHWYQEASHDVWYDIIELDSELDDFHNIEPIGAAERSVLDWAICDIGKQRSELIEDLRPQVRLAAADRCARKSLR